MQALILAAGEGTRLRERTVAIPKPMIEIAGKPILEHNVLLLASHGICDITINTYHQPKRIIDHFGDGTRFGVKISYSHERQLRGTAGALVPLVDTLLSTFVVIFGDNLTSCNLSKMLDFHRAKRAEATIALFFREDVRSSGVAEIESDGRIRRFIEKPTAGQISSNWVNAGIVFAEPILHDYVPRDRPSDLGRDIFPAMLTNRCQVFGYRMTEQLYWIDTPEDYERTSAAFVDDDSSRCR